MSDLRTAAQQALEVLEYYQHRRLEWDYSDEVAITALRAALAQQDEPVAGCETEADCTSQPWCRIRGECQRKQAEPVEPHRWEGDNNIESPFNACMHKTYCMTLKQAEPLNLSDPAVQKRLASQWGYVPAAQAEPVEPVAWVRLEAWKSGKDWPDDCFTALPAEGLTPVYTAPPQRKLVPLTEEEIDGLVIQHAGYGRDNFYAVARAVERAHGIKEN